MIYKYTAYTETGRLINDSINAKNKKSAQASLESRGWEIEKIELSWGGSFKIIFGISIGGVSFKDKLILTRNLSVMIKAGMTLDDALSILSEQSTNSRLSHILMQVHESILKGNTFSESLDEYPKVFSTVYVNIISAAEKSGTLEESLHQLAVQLEKSNELRGKLKNALFYPTLVISATFIVSILLAVFVLPKVTRIFVSFNAELPLTTRILIGFSNLVTDQTLLLVLGSIGIVGFVLFVTKVKTLQPFWHALILKLPVFGKLTHYFNLALFSRTLSTLLASGVPINQALEITATTINNVSYKYALEEVFEEQKSGESLGNLLQKHGRLFPPLVHRMIAVGEEAGNLEETLLFIAEFHEQEIDVLTKNLSSVLEPMLLVVIGVVVGTVALAIITPIYQITGNFQF